MKKTPDINYYLYLQRENDFFHQPYQYEQLFYEAITKGNVDFILKNQKKYAGNKSTSNEASGKGNLSENPVTNERYHFIINAAIIARYCIGAGYPQENAFTLSDIYIRKADKAESIDELQRLNDEMVLDFTKKMREHLQNFAPSPYIKKCINYIQTHLHEKITLKSLSSYADLNPSYLSTLFKKETGRSIHAYINEVRLDTAASMLRFSDYSILEIASAMNYSSQSHFSKAFKEYFNITPNEYRKMMNSSSAFN